MEVYRDRAPAWRIQGASQQYTILAPSAAPTPAAMAATRQPEALRFIIDPSV